MDINKTLEFPTHTDKEWIEIMDNVIDEMSGPRPNGTIVAGSEVAKIIEAYINQN